MLAKSLLYQVRAFGAAARRFSRLIVFGFEQIVLSRLFERRRAIAETITAKLLEAKAVRERPPELIVADEEGFEVPHWSHGFTAANAALFLNLRNPDGLSRKRHALPAPAFRGVYLWDSAFIAQVWRWWDREVAWDVLEAVLDARDGDRLQHYVSEYARSSLTQPPLIAWSFARLLDAGEADRLTPVYATLSAYQDWLDFSRRLPNGLYAWAHAYESGVENAPRFGTRDERRLRSTSTSAAPDFCAYVVLQREALSTMAQALGRREDARRHLLAADEVRRGVNAHLWDEEDGLYYDRETRDGRFIRSRTVASLAPLWAGIPDERRAARLIGQIADPEAFGTPLPIPSVALNDPAFERDMWRGPVWVNTAFGVLEGLRRYGAHALASALAFRLCDGVYATYGRTGRFYEFYDPTTVGVAALNRKRGNRWKAMTLGPGPVADFVGWTGLVNTIVIEMLFGVAQANGQFFMRPRFPPQAEGRRFRLSLPAWNLSVELTALQDGRTRGLAQGRAFEAGFGDLVPLEAGP